MALKKLNLASFIRLIRLFNALSLNTKSIFLFLKTHSKLFPLASHLEAVIPIYLSQKEPFNSKKEQQKTNCLIISIYLKIIHHFIPQVIIKQLIMGFNTVLFLSLFIPQVLIVHYFNKKNIQNTGVDKGSYNTAMATLGLIFSLFITLVSPFILYSEYTLGGGNTLATDIMMHVTLSFFVAHAILILIAKGFTLEITHHIMSAAGILYSLVAQIFGQDALMNIFFGEVTFMFYGKTIAKNMGWVTLEKQLDNLFFILFFIVRLVILPIYAYIFFSAYPETPLFLKFFAGAYLLLGFYYCTMMAKKRQSPQKE